MTDEKIAETSLEQFTKGGGNQSAEDLFTDILEEFYAGRTRSRTARRRSMTPYGVRKLHFAEGSMSQAKVGG